MRIVRISLFLTMFLLLVGLASFASAEQDTTTMTWVVPSSVSHSLSYGGNCNSTSFYFVESDANFGSAVDGNAKLIWPTSVEAGGANNLCQGATLAGITIQNTGNVAINIDGNFTVHADRNVVLKVSMGNGRGCEINPGCVDLNGVGCWLEDCNYRGISGGATWAATTAVSQNTCRQWSIINDMNAGRLVTGLAASDTNQLCLVGDINFGVAQGNTAKTFMTTAAS